MTTQTEAAALTLSNLVTRALSSESDMNGLSLSLKDCAVGGACLLVSGEGSQRKSEIEALADQWGPLFEGAVKVDTDAWADWDDGLYTCLWLNLDAAIASIEA